MEIVQSRGPKSTGIPGCLPETDVNLWLLELEQDLREVLNPQLFHVGFVSHSRLSNWRKPYNVIKQNQ